MCFPLNSCQKQYAVVTFTFPSTCVSKEKANHPFTKGKCGQPGRRLRVRYLARRAKSMGELGFQNQLPSVFSII